MLVKCDQCSQSYQVNETRLPPQGARIKCPACAHIFLVRPEASAITEVEPTPNIAHETQAPQEQNAEESIWKIRNSGLTYTFHDMLSLREWLGGRTTLKGVKIALGEDPWQELGDYPKVLTTELITKFFPLGDVPNSNQAKKRESSQSNGSLKRIPLAAPDSAPLSKSADLSISMASISTIKAVKKSRREQNNKSRNAPSPIKLAIVTVVCIAAIVFLLYTLDVIKFGPKTEVLPPNTRIMLIDGLEVLAEVETADSAADGVKTNTENQIQVVEQLEVAITPEIVVMSDEEKEAISTANLNKLKDEAKAMIKRSQWTEASVILSSIVEEHPDDIESKEMLARAYRKLRMNEQASALEAEIKQAKRRKK